MGVPKGKWIAGVRPDDLASEAGRQALERRLELVAHYLTRAADQRPEAEDIHQLRVASRRAEAALDAYGELLDPVEAPWFAKKLRQVRKAAGDARELDVLCDKLNERARQATDGQWKSLVKRVRRLRDDAHQPIRAIERKLHRRRFHRRIDDFIDSVEWRDATREEITFAALAREQLERVMQPFLVDAKGTFPDVDALHAFRIHGKSVRYAIEIFASAFGPELRAEVYKLIEELQAKLGEINDHVTALARYLEWGASWDDTSVRELIETLIQEEKSQLDYARREFHAWWNSDHAEDLERRFVTALQSSPAADDD